MGAGVREVTDFEAEERLGYLRAVGMDVMLMVVWGDLGRVGMGVIACWK